MATEVRRKPWERFSTSRQNAFARIGDIEDLSVDTFNLIITENEDLIDVTDPNTFFTTASFIDMDLASYVSGSLIDVDLTTSEIAASTAFIDFADSRDHDDGGADTYDGVKVAVSGDFPGTAASVAKLVNATYTGTAGASGNLGSVYGIHSDLSGGTNSNNAAYTAGYFTDGEGIVTLADSDATTTWGAKIICDTEDASNAMFGLRISKDIATDSAGAGTAQTNACFRADQASVNNETEIMTVGNSPFVFTEYNEAQKAGADVYSGTSIDVTYTAKTTGTGTATNSKTCLDIDYNLTETAGTLTVDDFNVVNIDYDSTGTPVFQDGVYNMLQVTADDAAVPVYGTCTLNGAFIDVSGIDTTDATLTLYGLSVSGAAAGTSATSAIHVTDGTQTLNIADGQAHISSTAPLIIEMPVPTVGADILTGTSNLAYWMPSGQLGLGGLIKMEFFIDLVGLSSVNDEGDVIGDTGGTTSASLGQYTTAIFGTIVAIEMVCVEVPAGGTPDIDLYSNATVLDVDEDASGGTKLIDSGANWTNGRILGKEAAVEPTADHYFHLVAGAAAAGDYTSGKFIIRFYGIPS